MLDKTKPDIEVLFEFNGLRKYPLKTESIWMHAIFENQFASGFHQYNDTEYAAPDGKVTGSIIFYKPENFRSEIYVGKKIPIHDAPSRLIGYATVTKICNPLLLEVD